MPQTPQSQRGASIYNAAFWGSVGVVAVAMIVVHVAAGLTLPAPWGDEAFFVWQARAFERFGNFAAPELDSTRPILLLPFVYQALLGIAFKIFGYSFELARAISLIFTITGFGLLAATVRRGSAPLVALVVIAGFMMSSTFVAMANNARMEALLFAIVCAALLLLQTGRAWAALAILALSPMVHPNGVLFLTPVAVHAVVNLQIYRTKPNRLAIGVFALAAFTWLANGLYAVSHWAGLMHDLAYRLSETTTANSGWEQYGGWHAVSLALIVSAGVVGAWRKVRIGHFIALAVGSWLMSRLRVETWYEVFGGLAYLMLSLAIIEIVMQEGPRLLRKRLDLIPRWTVPVSLAVLLIAFHVLGGRIPGPRNYISDLSLEGMTTSRNGVAYMTDEDRAAVESYILAKQADGARTFEIYPWGDTLLFGKLADTGIDIQIPYFDPTFSAGAETWAWGYGPTEWPTADVYIVRASRYQPRWLDERFEKVIARAEQRANATVERIRSRDSTEVWYAVVARKK